MQATGIPDVTAHSGSPLIAWLDAMQEQFPSSRREPAQRVRLSLNTLRRIRNGHLPLPNTLERMLDMAGEHEEVKKRLLAWTAGHRATRSLRRGGEAQCRECRGWEKTTRVRLSRTFRPASNGAPPSFVHQACRPGSGKVTLVCPEGGEVCRPCWSKARKREHRSKLRTDGSYGVYCKKHYRPSTDQLRALRVGLRRHFRRRFAMSKYAKKYSWKRVWDGAEQRDETMRAIRSEVMQWGHHTRPRLYGHSPKRGPAISRGQALLRWASQKDIRLCKLCWKLVEGRDFHALCFEVWRRTPQYYEKREPPVPGFIGRPPRADKIAQKWTWFTQQLANSDFAQKVLAAEARLTQQAVAEGIQTLKRWLPEDWSLVLRRLSTARVYQDAYPLPDHGARDSRGEKLVRWLASWRMPGEAIARLLGYSIGEVYANLERPVLLDADQGLARVVPSDSVETWWVEAWSGVAWEPTDITLAEVCNEGEVAPQRAIRARGAVGPPSITRRAPHTGEQDKLCVGGFVIDRRRPHIVAGGRSTASTKAVVLTGREFSVLECLARQPGLVVDPTRLAQSVWPRANGSAIELLTVYISHLRKKLGDDLIHTVHGSGYSLGPPKFDPPKRAALFRAVADADGNLAQAAAQLGIPRSTLHYRVRKSWIPATA